MSFYVALALPRVAWIATDTRMVFPDGSRRDGFSKVANFAGGWLTGSVIEGAQRIVAPALAACKSPAEMREVLLAARASIDDVVARAPDVWRPIAARSAGFFIVEPSNLTRLNGPRFDLERLGTQAIFQPPLGVRAEDFADLYAAYGDHVRRCFLEPATLDESAAIREIIKHTRTLFAEAFKRCGGDEGPMGPHLEMGFVRSTSGGLEWLHLPPALADGAQPDALRPVAVGDVRYGWIGNDGDVRNLVGAGVPDYGLPVFDNLGGTVMDVTGAKRIFAIPVQPSADSGASITVDLSTGLTQQVRLTSNTATVTLQNPVNGSRYRIWFQQDTVGSRPFPTINETVMFTNDTAPTLSTEPGALDLVEFEYRTSPTARFSCMVLQTNVKLPTPAYPVPTGSGNSTATTSLTVSAPASVVSGELLLIAIAVKREGSTSPPLLTTPSGWTLVGSSSVGDASGGNNATVLAFYARVSDGTEGGSVVTITASAASFSASLFYRITKHGGVGNIAAAFATNANESPAMPNPPSVTPGWTNDRNLWLAAFALNVMIPATGTPTAPTNYTNLLWQSDTDPGGHVTVGVARRTLYASSQDPSAFEVDGLGSSWVAATVAVRPPA